jgi:hypothetical protein
MQYLFLITDNPDHITHTRDADGATGKLLSFTDSVKIHTLLPILTSDTGFTPIPEPTIAPALEEPEPVPHSITAWQAKAGLALTPHPQAGTMLVAAEAALAAMPEGAEKIVVLSAWNNNANFERTSPTILSFGAALGMTSDDLDNLFRVGGSLTV